MLIVKCSASKEPTVLFTVQPFVYDFMLVGCVGYRSCDVRRGKILPEAIRTQFDEHGFRRYITYCLNREVSRIGGHNFVKSVRRRVEKII